MKDVVKTIDIEVRWKSNSSIPKYVQIANSIGDDILSGSIAPDHKLPSINDLSEVCSLSRDTIEKAYNILRDRDLIHAIRGIGYFAKAYSLDNKQQVLFLINKPSSYKMEVFNAFVDTIGSTANVDMHLYYADENLFIEALNKNLNKYSHFVIMPHFKTADNGYVSYTAKVIKAIESIPKEKRIIIDNSYQEISGTTTAIYQDYQNDIHNALEMGLQKLVKYEKLILIYPTKTVFPFPPGIRSGFESFCKEFEFQYEILDSISHELDFKSNEVYITIEDEDLVCLLQQIKAKKLVMGHDVGIISYNETPLKSILDITVISTDFKGMGQSTAKLLLNNKKEIKKNPFNYIERHSL